MGLRDYLGKVIDESVPNLVEDTIYKSRSCDTNRINPRKSMPRCIIVKHLKIRDKEKFKHARKEPVPRGSSSLNLIKFHI